MQEFIGTGTVSGQTLDKSKAQKVRNKIIKLLDDNCSNCFTKSNNCKLYGQFKAYKYCNEKCEIGKKLQELGKIIGDERSSVWSDDEVYYLLHHYQLYSVDHLAERLKRTPKDVEMKLRRLAKKNLLRKDNHVNVV